MARALDDRIETVLRRHPIEFAYVFGSRGRGKPGPRSDLDLGLFMAPRLKPLARQRLRLQLLRELRSAAGSAAQGIDLVLLNDCPLNLSFSVVQGRLLFSRNERRRVLLEAGIRSRYFDRLHYVQRGAARVLRRTANLGVAGAW